MTNLRTQLIQYVKKVSYREGDFTLSSGQKSSFYIDLKPTTLSGKGAWLVGETSVEAIQKYENENGIKIEGVGGLTLGADPIATAVSLSAYHRKIDWPAFIVRKESKGHGTGKYVEGTENLKKGAKLIVLEDVTTTGASSIKAVERLRAEGYDPVAILVIVDREQGGEAAVRAQKLDFIKLLSISDLKSYHA